MSDALKLAGATISWLHHESFDEALQHITQAGLTSVEISTIPPHLQSTTADAYQREILRRRTAELGLKVVSVNPSGLDINLVSMNSEVRALGMRLIRAELELAADLGAPFVVLSTGRLHPLAPPPRHLALSVLAGCYSRLAVDAERLGVTMLVETVPYGFLASGPDLLTLVRAVDSPQLGVVYDVANVLAFEDPCDGLRSVQHHLGLVHVSDTLATHWTHTSPGLGEIDFPAVREVLTQIGYKGITVYELVDGKAPTRYEADINALSKAGWTC